MKTGFAQITVQNNFCLKCQHKIRKHLSAIEDISNVRLYPEDSLIVFNFIRANEIAKALNTLTELGYPPSSDLASGKCQPAACSCNFRHIAKPQKSMALKVS